MDLADERGLEGVSMRNVASKLGVGTMSLYRYVDEKDQLLDLILDAAYSEIPLPERPTGDWGKDMALVARSTRKVLKGHPWLAPLLTMRPTLGPNYLRWFEFLLAATAPAGVTVRMQVRMIGTVWSYVTGFVAYELGEMETNQRENLTEDKKRELAAPYVSEILATGEFPWLSQFLNQTSGEPSTTDFEFGLKATINGLGTLLA